mgnify:CR=1 FL=1
MGSSVCQDFISKIEEIAKGLEAGKGFMNSDYIHDFTEKVRQAKTHADEIISTNRDLKIGIIGQVKAGKSSFLNALIFEGQDILPKAATPMTAALTRIIYSEKQTAKVVFYSPKDWDVIRENAKRFDEELQQGIEALKAEKQRIADEQKTRMQKVKDLARQPQTQEPTPQEIETVKTKIPELYRSCKELVDMADSGNCKSKLGHEEEISVANLKQDLQQYVGAEGKYTPIVKWIELGINNPLIKGIEIIDTPGLGDPVTSRSEKTKEFLMACDLVFILSPTSQFLGSEDISLIMDTLPGDSINHAVIVGSKFDSVMLDDSSRGKPPLIQVIRRTRDKLDSAARRVIADSAKAERGIHAEVLRRINEEVSAGKSLYYTSAILYNAAKNIASGRSLAETEEHILAELKRRFEGMREDPEFLRELAGIDRIREIEFAKIAQEKESIIEERSREFVKAQQLYLSGQLNRIQAECEQNLRLIQTEDIDGLSRKQKASRDAQASMRIAIQREFELCAADTAKYIVGIAHSIKSRALDNTGLNIREEREDKEHSSTSGMLWWKKTTHYTTTTYHKAANVGDVIGNIHKYITDSENRIAQEIERAIDVEGVRTRIKDIVLQAFNKSNADFEPEDIIGPVEVLLSKLTVPPFSIVDPKKYDNWIVEAFPNSRILDEAIHDLERKQTEVLRDIAHDISTELEKRTKDIQGVLLEQSVHFTDEVGQKINEKINNLQILIQDREKNTELMKEFLGHLAKYKERLR